MIATLTRFDSSDQGTFGKLTFGNSTLFTVELPDRNNASDISRIPAGVYKCVWTYSPRFKTDMYLLLNVPNRSGIRIHSANMAGDASMGWTRQLNGCIAIATKLGHLKIREGVMQKAGLASAPAVRELERWGNKQPFTLEIK